MEWPPTASIVRRERTPNRFGVLDFALSVLLADSIQTANDNGFVLTAACHQERQTAQCQQGNTDPGCAGV